LRNFAIIKGFKICRPGNHESGPWSLAELHKSTA
jgi:hypothetical protein